MAENFCDQVAYFLRSARYFFNLGCRPTLSRLPIYLLFGGVSVRPIRSKWPAAAHDCGGELALSGRICWPAVCGSWWSFSERGALSTLGSIIAHTLSGNTHPLFLEDTFLSEEKIHVPLSIIHLWWRRRFCDKRVHARRAHLSHRRAMSQGEKCPMFTWCAPP